MKKLLFVSVSVVACVCLLVPLGTRPKAKNYEDASEKNKLKAGPQSSRCSTCPEVADQTIYAPLVTLPESTGTEINLNCRSPHTIEVTPTFYTRQGQALVGNRFVMQAGEVKTIDLKTLMPLNIRNRKDLGGMSLSYTGRPLEMWGQLRLLRAQNGGSFDVVFVYLPDRRSAVRNSVWSTSTHDTAVIAIGNPRNTPTKALVQFANGEIKEIEVAAFGTEIIRRRSPQQGDLTADGVTVRSADGSVDLIVAGAVLSANRGFSGSIRFYDTEVVAQQNLFATNFRLHNVNSTLVLRNVGAADLTATPRIRPVSGDPNNFVDLPAVMLKANEMQTIDLTPFALTTQHDPAFKNVSVEIINTGAKGSLVGALNGQDQITGLNYDVPLRDSGGTRNSTGAYPWRIDGDFSTIASITNVSALPTQFIVQIRYAGGRYTVNPQTLLAGATATFDLRRIRDEQIPDRDGNTIPLSIEGGQFRWSVFGPGIGRLIGRAEMLSVSRGISSSYSCGTTCPPSFDRGWVDPDPVTVPEGGAEAVDALQINVDSFSNEYGPYSSNVVSWWSSDTNVATLNFGTVSAVAVGSTTLNATVEFPLYFWDTSTFDCIENGTNQTNVNGSATVTPTITVGNVTVTPNSIKDGVAASLKIVLAASSGITNTTGTTLEVSITDSTGGFTLHFGTPPTQQVSLNSGESKEFTFPVTVATSPTMTQTCKLAAHVTPATGIMVINNGQKSETLSVNPP